ncbi:ectoine/hydroxyectoine ABC transporter permease subunit EhuC [Paeniglutamicibacter gangotriensis]|nr:ectoine/hydroxyectoine ABC transporter permease subunit EhuC [Paeniglutamicibacter gangotriensis]
MDEKLAALVEAMPRLLDGISVTVQLTVLGGLAAFALSVALGLAATHPSKAARIPARIIIEFFRGTSLVVQLFWLFYVMPLLGVDMHPLVVGVLALGLNYGAYGAEVVRGSINSVATGQWEATTALSMGSFQRMRRVIFPQAWALMIPSLNNLLIHLMKGTAIVSFITIADFTYHLDQLKRVTDTVFSYGVIGLLSYFVIALILTFIMNALERRAKRRLGQGITLKSVLSPAPATATPGGGGA